ncbi:ubiquinone biosynthesis accessory factor UbiJ [Thalassotalea eurytherma]|uniref:Ubiquinone biosynthesis accessory factor UbiJ n=1 Tax=Thalassotalea eurytherma TaxID=1144278 RepID=A0ABQ6GXQ0_9GAMM|nr:SCP2 sterol-binding domain-containing protein [Thalassotalea eurytherma]GLX80718.1 DUF1243 domain-containing protein [Thalassotalea eurytherma]
MMNWLLPTQMLGGAIEAAINQALAKNINTRVPIEQLAGKHLKIHIDEIGVPITIGFSQSTAYVLTDDVESDCTISTSLKTLAELKQSQQLTELIKQEKLDIQGDLKTAQQFAQVFEQLTIDWQSEIAKHIGDVATYRLSQAFGFVQEKADFAKQQISEDFSQWLVYEKKLAVNNVEIQHFKNDVNQVSQRVNGLMQRLTKLDQQINFTKE